MTTVMVPINNGRTILIPAICGDFVEIFSKAKEEILPPHQSIDHALDLEPGYNLAYGQITIELNAVESNWVQVSRVVRYSCNSVEYDHMLT